LKPQQHFTVYFRDILQVPVTVPARYRLSRPGFLIPVPEFKTGIVSHKTEYGTKVEFGESDRMNVYECVLYVKEGIPQINKSDKLPPNL